MHVRLQGAWALGMIAACAVGVQAGVEWNGDLVLDTRLRLREPYEICRQEYRLSLQATASPGTRTKLFADVWLRYLDGANLAEVSDLQVAGRVLPVGLSLREAYFDVYGPGLDGLDVRLGRQRIPWGRADRVNPTDNLNPDDLVDLWDFGRHLASDALNLKYYFGDFSLQGVYIPLFRPALLPGGKWLEALYPDIGLPEEYEAFLALETPTDSVLLPDPRPIQYSSGGLRFAGRLVGVDFSVSYAYVRHDIPVIDDVILSPRGTFDLSGPLPTDVEARLAYPRAHVAGGDLFWTLGSVGMWGEAAVFFSEEVTTTARIDESEMSILLAVDSLLMLNREMYGVLHGEPMAVDTPLDGTPYVKFIVGLDYTFPFDLYINFQYAHGFTHEYGDGLEDYFMFDSHLNLFRDRLTLAPLMIGMEVGNWNNVRESYAVLWQSTATWKPVDNVSLGAGVRLIRGGAESTYGAMNDSDEAFVHAEYSF